MRDWGGRGKGEGKWGKVKGGKVERLICLKDGKELTNKWKKNNGQI